MNSARNGGLRSSRHEPIEAWSDPNPGSVPIPPTQYIPNNGAASVNNFTSSLTNGYLDGEFSLKTECGF